jgi:hypothetical protein
VLEKKSRREINWLLPLTEKSERKFSSKKERKKKPLLLFEKKTKF